MLGADTYEKRRYTCTQRARRERGAHTQTHGDSPLALSLIVGQYHASVSSLTSGHSPLRILQRGPGLQRKLVAAVGPQPRPSRPQANSPRSKPLLQPLMAKTTWQHKIDWRLRALVVKLPFQRPPTTARVPVRSSPLGSQPVSRGLAPHCSSAFDDHEVFCAASFVLARLVRTILGALGSQGCLMEQLRVPQAAPAWASVGPRRAKLLAGRGVKQGRLPPKTGSEKSVPHQRSGRLGPRPAVDRHPAP